MSCNAAVPTAAVQISEAGTTIVQVIPVCGVTAISGAVTLSILSTTQTSSSTSSSVTTNTLTGIQTSSSSSSSSVSKSSSSSSVSISSVSTSSAPVSSSFVPIPSSRSLPLGAIIGAPLAVLAVLSLVIIFLLFRLKRRKETRLQGGSPALASVTPFEFSVTERPGGHVSDELRSATPLTFTTPTGASSPVPNTYNTRGKHSRTPGSLATTSSSDLNSHPIPSNISDDLNAIRTHRTLSYVVSNPTIQPASTNDSDRAPPAYDTLTNRMSSQP